MKTRTFVIGLSLSSMATLALASGDFSAMQQRLGIPDSVATVVDASGKKPDVVLIQDIHRHPEAQENIRAVILRGLKAWGVREVFLEGAWSAGQNKDFAFLGLEDPDVYRENVVAYQAVEKVRDDALRELETAKLFGRVADADSSDSWAQLKRLIQLRLKPSEYAEYMKNPYRPETTTPLASAALSAEHFYEVANKRSGIFLENARKLHRSGTQVLVVGGFHTKAMAEELRKKGISYVVLSPRITQGGFEELYANGMHETVSALKLQ